ncbi:hypothetical protein SK128_027138 [Halocaridina rubra]|uniref:Uncharacterized protein n=1 Tax=Halocaridina rubra TaxID=373956 RepID=A0AAN8XPE3_HALRR
MEKLASVCKSGRGVGGRVSRGRGAFIAECLSKSQALDDVAPSSSDSGVGPENAGESSSNTIIPRNNDAITMRQVTESNNKAAWTDILEIT